MPRWLQPASDEVSKHDLLADAKRLQVAIEDTQGILDRIEAARGQLSVLGDELRGQNSIIKERLQWIIREMDELKRLVKQV